MVPLFLGNHTQNVSQLTPQLLYEWNETDTNIFSCWPSAFQVSMYSVTVICTSILFFLLFSSWSMSCQVAEVKENVEMETMRLAYRLNKPNKAPL